MKLFDYNHEKYHLGHFVMDHLVSRPDAICQIDAVTGESETNASVLHRSVQFARCLRRFGFQPGDIMALGGNHNLDLNIAHYAGLFNGMPITGVDPISKYDQLKAHFKISSPKLILCQKKDLDDNLQVIKDLKLNAKLICFDDEEYSLKRFIEQYDDTNEVEEFAPLDFDLDKIYGWLITTSGVTGMLKVAAFKHKMIMSKILKRTKVVENINALSLALTPINCVSAFHNALSTLYLEHTNLLVSIPATPEHVIDVINKYKPKIGLMSPYLATTILDNEKEIDFTCFIEIFLSGSKAPKEVYQELKKRMRADAEIYNIYGQTESLGIMLIPNPKGPIGNSGVSPPGQGIVKLMDPDTDKEITGANIPGELWIKNYGLSEYYNNPEETANVLTHDGWLKTGDVLYKDEQGNYFYVERLKMLNKYRSHPIIASVLEAVIRKHTDVEDVAVTTIPHKEDGHHPVACVVKRNGVNVTAQEIKNIVAEKLSETQQLRGGVAFIDEIPRTTTGKVALKKLEEIVLTANRE